MESTSEESQESGAHSGLESSAVHQEGPPLNLKKRKAKANIVLNVSDCQYSVVSRVSKALGWRRQTSSEANSWDVFWTDNAVHPETLINMQSHQKINHFPGMFNLARKNLLGKGLMAMKKLFPVEYDFFPLTWLLPGDYQDLKGYLENKTAGKGKTLIVKPESLSQGKGIFLTRKIENIPAGSHCVVQRYLHKPYLIQGLKFDLRIYVLISSVDPLRIYLYEEGLARFATEQYKPPTKENMDDVCMHLTNYAINKDSPKFVFNQSQQDMSKGHKRSLTSVLQLLKQEGIDTDALMAKIKASIVKTMISGLPHLRNAYRSCQPHNCASNMCFELLGFDVMLTEKCQPVILQINHTPSFTTDTPLDQFIKFNYIHDALVLMNINQRSKKDAMRRARETTRLRVLTGTNKRLTCQEKDAKRIIENRKKQKYENAHLGKFERLYPTADEIDPYKDFIQQVDKMHEANAIGPKKVFKSDQQIDRDDKLTSKSSLKQPVPTDVIFKKELRNASSRKSYQGNFQRKAKQSSNYRASQIEKQVQIPEALSQEQCRSQTAVPSQKYVQFMASKANRVSTAHSKIKKDPFFEREVFRLRATNVRDKHAITLNTLFINDLPQAAKTVGKVGRKMMVNKLTKNDRF